MREWLDLPRKEVQPLWSKVRAAVIGPGFTRNALMGSRQQGSVSVHRGRPG
jgi:hypothetical protein